MAYKHTDLEIETTSGAFEDGEDEYNIYDEEDEGEGHEKSTSSAQQDINAVEAAEEADLWLSFSSLVSALSEASPMTLSPSSSFNASNRSGPATTTCSMIRKAVVAILSMMIMPITILLLKLQACLLIGDTIQPTKTR